MREHTTKYPKCSRPGCRRVIHSQYYTYCWQHLRAQGMFHPLRSATPAAHHVDKLIIMGFTAEAIAAAAGVHNTTIIGLNSNNQRRSGVTLKAVEDKILATTPARIMATGIGHAPAWPYARRVRALRTLGIGIREIVDGADITKTEAISLSREDNRHRIPITKAHQIDEYYRKNIFTPKVATRNPPIRSWAPPLAWDNIDNPTETPLQGSHRRQTFVPVTAAHRRAIRNARANSQPIHNVVRTVQAGIASGELGCINLDQHLQILTQTGYGITLHTDDHI